MNLTDQKTSTVTLEREERFRFRVRFGDTAAAPIVTDEPPPLGQGTGPNPAMLLGAAVGNCLASSLLFCLQRVRLDVSGLDAEVEVVTRRNEQGRMRIPEIRVTLAPEVSPEVERKMARCLEVFESFCLVTESVREGIDVRVSVKPMVDRKSAVGALIGEIVPSA